MLALSLAGPAGSGAAGAALVTLMLLHLVVGVTLLVGLGGGWPDSGVAPVRAPSTEEPGAGA